MNTLEDRGLVKVSITFVDQGTLRVIGAIVPADEWAEILAGIDKAGLG